MEAHVTVTVSSSFLRYLVCHDHDILMHATWSKQDIFTWLDQLAPGVSCSGLMHIQLHWCAWLAWRMVMNALTGSNRWHIGRASYLCPLWTRHMQRITNHQPPSHQHNVACKTAVRLNYRYQIHYDVPYIWRFLMLVISKCSWIVCLYNTPLKVWWA